MPEHDDMSLFDFACDVENKTDGMPLYKLCGYRNAMELALPMLSAFNHDNGSRLFIDAIDAVNAKIKTIHERVCFPNA